MILLASKSASNSATIDFSVAGGDLGFTDVYDEYVVHFSQVKPQTDAAYLGIRVGTGATPTWQAGVGAYGWALCYQGLAGTATGDGSTPSGGTLISMTPVAIGVGNAASEHISGTVEYSNPDTADYPSFSFRTRWLTVSAEHANASGGGNYGATTAFTGLRFIFSTGNIVSGTFKLYGIRKT
jgi:hypothetical protein